jgi:hypothetical protein
VRYASRMSSLTADQASFTLHTLGLPALRAELPFTTVVIAAIPAGGADYRPHADSRSAFELSWHIVSAEIKYFDAVDFETTDVRTPEPFGDFCRIGEGRGRNHEQARSGLKDLAAKHVALNKLIDEQLARRS